MTDPVKSAVIVPGFYAVVNDTEHPGITHLCFERDLLALEATCKDLFAWHGVYPAVITTEGDRLIVEHGNSQQ